MLVWSLSILIAMKKEEGRKEEGGGEGYFVRLRTFLVRTLTVDNSIEDTFSEDTYCGHFTTKIFLVRTLTVDISLRTFLVRTLTVDNSIADTFSEDT